MLAERIANFRQAPPQPREARYDTNHSSGHVIDIRVVHAAEPCLQRSQGNSSRARDDSAAA